MIFALIGLFQTCIWTFRAMRLLFCSLRADPAKEMKGLEDHEIPVHLTLDCAALQARRDLPVLKTHWGGKIYALKICGACLKRELTNTNSNRHRVPEKERSKIYLSTTSLYKLKTL